jgi:hypothetical protein
LIRVDPENPWLVVASFSIDRANPIRMTRATRRWLSFALAVLFSPAFVFAAAAPKALITNIAGRTTISF